MFIDELPYREESALLFGQWAQEPWAVFLDSGRPDCNQGRYDILAARPHTTLVTRGKLTEIRNENGIRLSPQDPFSLVQEMLGDPVEAQGFPFCGGAIGYFSYDLARRLETLPLSTRDLDGLPEMAVGIYDWACIVDHKARHTVIVGRDHTAAQSIREELLAGLRKLRHSPGGSFHLHSPVQSNLDWEDYVLAFEKIQHYIREGDCYQVNFAQRFTAPASGDPWTLYRDLRHINPAPFSAFLRLPHCTVVSSSPERFLHVRGGQVETKPIKGTRPRGFSPEEDLFQIEALAESTKDQAENLMIVDLLRNDLSKTCQLGTVKVPRLFDVESFATVHHLVSTVVGQLEEKRHALDLLRGCFPGGSITGAPKIRAMEIIEELEPARRSVYCGAIGYIGYDGAMDTNIAIRTIVYSSHRICFWAGGGIVADSDVRKEYQESFDKASALMQALSRFQLATDRVGG